MQPQRLLLIVALALAGCNGPAGEPFDRPGTWRLGQDNDSNLEAMVANPADLQRGHGDGLALGDTAAAAVERLRTGNVKRLPASGVLQVVPVGSGGPAATAGTPQ
jgi:hypothetical protein